MRANEKRQLILASIATTGLFILVLFLLSNFSPLRERASNSELEQALEQLTEASATVSAEASASGLEIPLDLDWSDLTSPE
jgi:ABC-type Fe3+ transport system permease subunit